MDCHTIDQIIIFDLYNFEILLLLCIFKTLWIFIESWFILYGFGKISTNSILIFEKAHQNTPSHFIYELLNFLNMLNIFLIQVVKYILLLKNSLPISSIRTINNN